jgi:hypothetical protein
MKALIAVLVALLAFLGLPAAAAAQCNCPAASLLNTPVSATYSSSAGAGPTLSWTASFLTDYPSAGPAFGMGGSALRLNIDLGPNTIQLFFIDQPQTYGPGTKFTFTNLFPKVQSGWPGACTAIPEIAGLSVQTKPAAMASVTANTAFTAHSVTVSIAGQWNPGDSITVRLSYQCGGGQATTCCPPLTTAKLKSMLQYQGTGGIDALYFLHFAPTAQLNNQMVAYQGLLNSTNPPVPWVSAEFSLYNAGTGIAPVQTGGPLHVYSWGWPGSLLTSASLFPLGLNPNQWYRVRVRFWRGSAISPVLIDCPDLVVDVRMQAP